MPLHDLVPFPGRFAIEDSWGQEKMIKKACWGQSHNFSCFEQGKNLVLLFHTLSQRVEGTGWGKIRDWEISWVTIKSK